MSDWRSAPALRALWGIALGVALVRPGWAQDGEGGSAGGGSSGAAGSAGSGSAGSGSAGSGSGDMCMPNAGPPDCTERCPRVDTCTRINGDDISLYYSVADQRFDCDGLDCRDAANTLADYCCQRGEFAPASSADDGGGCSVGRLDTGANQGEAGSEVLLAAAGLCVGLALRARRRGPGVRTQPRHIA